MTSSIDDLLSKIKLMEQELLEEIQSQQQNFAYEIQQKRIYFEKQVVQQHKTLCSTVIDYLKNASFKHILTVPVIWAILIPAVLLDITVTLYQADLFSSVWHPQSQTGGLYVFDRRYLSYLNIVEKINVLIAATLTAVLPIFRK